MLAAVLVTSAAAARDAFIGRWHSTDIVDSSNQTMSIRGGPGDSRMASWYDDNASVACGDGVPAFISGSFTENAAGDRLDGTVDVTCLATPTYSGGSDFPWFFEANQDGSLTDPDGTTWYRGP